MLPLLPRPLHRRLVSVCGPGRVRAGEQLWRRSLRAGTSYLACEPAELVFGLGEARSATVEVRWPWGEISTHEVPDLDRWVCLERP